MIGAVLIGDDQEEIGFSIHSGCALFEESVYHNSVLMQSDLRQLQESLLP